MEGWTILGPVLAPSSGFSNRIYSGTCPRARQLLKRISANLQGSSDLSLALGLLAGIEQEIASRLQASSDFVAQNRRRA